MATLRETSNLYATLLVSALSSAAVIAVAIFALETVQVLYDGFYLLFREVCLRLITGETVMALINSLLRVTS